jgi:hypothetical protein
LLKDPLAWILMHLVRRHRRLVFGRAGRRVQRLWLNLLLLRSPE